MGTYVIIGYHADKCDNCVSDTQVYCTATAVNVTFKSSLSFIITITLYSTEYYTLSFLSTWREITYLSNILFSLERLSAAVWAVS